MKRLFVDMDGVLADYESGLALKQGFFNERRRTKDEKRFEPLDKGRL